MDRRTLTRPDFAGFTWPAQRPWLPSLCVGLLASLAFLGPALFAPTRDAIGDAAAEGPTHLWGLWTAAQGLFQHGPFIRVASIGHPGHFAEHLMDPVNLLLFLPGYWLAGGQAAGAVLGWNLLHLGVLALTAWGCWRLGARLLALGGQPLGSAEAWAIALFVGVVCFSPFLVGYPQMGRTEYLPAAFYPWHLALLHRWLRDERPGFRVGAGAGLLLGVAASGGGYLAVFLVLIEVPTALAFVWGRPILRSIPRLVLVGGLALALAGPPAAMLAAHPPSGIHIGAGPLPSLQTDHVVALPLLLRMDAPGYNLPWMEQAAYPGLAALGLGLLGVFFRPRNTLGWLALAVYVTLWGLGPFLMDGQGDPRVPGPMLPAGWLETALPPLRTLSNWSRIGCLLSIPIGVAALFGAAGLLRCLPGWSRAASFGVLALLVLADQGTWPSRYQIKRPTFRIAAPPELLAFAQSLTPKAPGALVQYPLDLPRWTQRPEIHGDYLLWQPQHGRPIASSRPPHHDGTLPRNYLSRLVARAQLLGQTAPSMPEIRCARDAVSDLRFMGFSGIVLHRDQHGAKAAKMLLDQVLGPPHFDQRTVAGWDLTRIQPIPPESNCELPPLPSHLSGP